MTDEEEMQEFAERIKSMGIEKPELDDDYQKPLPETRQEELLRAETEARREAIARLVDGDDPEFEKVLWDCGYFFSTRELDIAALFWHLARQR